MADLKKDQLSIFDMLEPETEEKFICDDCIYDNKGRCGYNTKDDYCVLGDKKIIRTELKTPAEIWAEETGFSDYWQHDTEFINDKPVCTYSKHSCNRKELWKQAEALGDPFCPHVCCRFCNTKCCGARCNGSSEPVKKISLQFEEYKEHCRHNGWTRGSTETEPAAVMCSFNNRQNAKCWDDWIECNMDNCPLLK